MAKWLEIKSNSVMDFCVNLDKVDCIRRNPEGKAVITFTGSEEYIITADDYEYIVNNAKGLCNYA